MDRLSCWEATLGPARPYTWPNYDSDAGRSRSKCPLPAPKNWCSWNISSLPCLLGGKKIRFWVTSQGKEHSLTPVVVVSCCTWK
ncbi:hypothetical protein FKM82_011690 [Ascaphus truei]